MITVNLPRIVSGHLGWSHTPGGGNTGVGSLAAGGATVPRITRQSLGLCCLVSGFLGEEVDPGLSGGDDIPEGFFHPLIL